jgi:hypothetical protein
MMPTKNRKGPPMKLKITSLCDGFDGRDYFPKKSDVGTIVVVIEAWVESMSMVIDRKRLSKMSAEERADLYATMDAGDDDANSYTVYTCLAADGRIIDVVQFEATPIGMPLWSE